MTTIRISKSWFVLLTAAGLAGGCAKRQEVVAEPPPTPPPAPVAEPTPPKPVDTGSELRDFQALIGHTVLHFDFDEAALKPDDQHQLQTVGSAMRSTPKAKIRIEGNCDERGTEEYNLALGYRRAAVAKKYLSDFGIDNTRIETISYGFNKPVDTRHNEAAWAANRRDDLASLTGD
jgi:peptidoglycan-associated lipoprotein